MSGLEPLALLSAEPELGVVLPPGLRRLYGGDHYAALKSRWDPEGRLPDLYAKAVRGA